MPSDKNSSHDITISQKYLEKIVKLQQDQEVARLQEYELLMTHFAQMNVLLDQLISVSGSGSTVAATKKTVPFQTGSQQAGQLLIKPSNQDGYPTNVDVYKINDNRVVPHMTLINDGPGEIFFINAYAKDVFNTEEGHLNVNDQRELFNVYEIRLRSTLPLTTFRLIEGIFRTGGTAPQTTINIIQKPTIQTNQLLKQFAIRFDLDTPITISSPTVQNFPVNNVLGISNNPPLPPGQTAALVDIAANVPMPFTIPEGFLLESYALVVNSTTNYTIRSYLEFFTSPATSPIPIFSRVPTLPGSPRGAPINQVLNISTPFSTTFPPPPGSGGRRILVTITNDDPFNNMIGLISFVVILSRVV